ncbi:hypothetical protein MKZ38_008682 [Zalerion maritima]|uniref:PQ loop repeat protein n=1 Tax=Zalerion maritima TaxID=339359 RepID=A0AAD5RGI9_9PEZI|nr:hypothetical protein MKZ38_008682 [Zalerion maritima]
MADTSSALVMRDSSGKTLAERCDKLSHPGYLSLTISIMILVGLLVSYLPQHWRIISRRTSEGISPYFVLLGVTSATSSFANIVMLPGSQEAIQCCKTIGAFECMAGVLGIAQFAVQFLCFAFILLLFLVFFRLDDATVPDNELNHELQPRWETALTVAWVCLLHGVIILIVSATIGIVKPKSLGYWANILGVEASGLAIIQYAPQIWTTYRLKHVGSLSIPMMCIQTPGGYLFAGSLYARLGARGWSSWAIILVTASSQAVLLVLAIYYELLNRRSSDEVGPRQSLFYRHRDRNAPQNGDANGRKNSHSPIRIDHRIYGPNGVYDPDMPGPYTAHPSNYADTPEDFDTIMSREDSQAAAEDSPLLRRGGIGNPRRYDSDREREQEH